MSSLNVRTTFPTEADLPVVPAVRFEGVSVRYRVTLDPGVSLKEYLVRGRRRHVIEHDALRSIDLEIRKGESVGVIGANGAGKTTLLKLIARVLSPSAGRIRIHGTVAPVIDLFGAMHPELTGGENAFLNGALMGVSHREMRERVESIRDFAAIGEYFDAPLRTYSAGMLVRLAFAVATSVDANILLVDEALGVGDASFQQKCAARMEAFRERGVTFIVVSHDVLRLADTCDRIVWLDAGRIVEIGGREVVARYLTAQQS